MAGVVDAGAGNRMSSLLLERVVKTFEVFEPKLYLDPVGIPTIGYGHRVWPDERARFQGRTLSEDEATELMRTDLALASGEVDRLTAFADTSLADYQRDALTSFTFNLGAKRFEGSTLRQTVLHGKPQEAARQFIRWIYAGDKVQGGLVKRRHAEAVWYLGAPEETVLWIAQR